ncbi:MAG: hypothetical protein R2799_05100 [Crocinitomicaceae bacterium]
MYQTEQEKFWAGDFGDQYCDRNQGKAVEASKTHFWSRVLHHVQPLDSIFEFGANIGLNLKVLGNLLPDARRFGIEVNENAHKSLVEVIGEQNAIHGSILDLEFDQKVDLTFTVGVLIHINPMELEKVYERLYKYSKRYILVAEYYNPAPVMINYRGESDRLFKRDFAGEIMKKYPDLELVHYGFAYHGDPVAPQDDITWFLMEKK